MQPKQRGSIGRESADLPEYAALLAGCSWNEPRSVEIERAALERFERNELENALVRRRKHDLRRHVRLQRLDEAQHVQAPAIPGLQPAKAHLRPRRAEIVPALIGEREKLGRDLDAYQM